MHFTRRKLVLITLVVLATAPADAVRRLARWTRSTRATRSMAGGS
jgi:hypothetical protein